jgi:hypothetical protein
MINIIFLLVTFFHPFYVSVTEINHNSKNKTIEISSKIFFDDLEHDIEKENKISFDIIKPIDKVKVNALIANYVKKHLILKIDGKVYALNFVGYEIQGEAAWCYFEIPKINKISTIEINNNILHQLHAEQINMLNVTVAGKRQSTKLDAPDSKVSFKF